MRTPWRAAALALPILTALWPSGASAQASRPTPASAATSRPAASRPAASRPAASRPAADPPAETLAKAGRLFALKRYGEARALYQLALAERPRRYGLLLRIAGCDERLGGARNVERALRGYRRYLKAKPRSPLRARVQGRIARLERRLEELARSTDGTEPGTVPAYKTWWFWTALVAVVGGVVVGIVLASQVDDDVPTGRGGLSTGRGGLSTRRGGLSWSF